MRRPVAYKKSVTSSRLPNISYDEPEYNGEGGREERRKKEVEDLISKYAKKKEKDEVSSSHLLHMQQVKKFILPNLLRMLIMTR